MSVYIQSHHYIMEIGYTKPMVVVFDGHLLNIVKCLAQKEYVGLLLSHPEMGRIMVNTVVRQVELQWEVGCFDQVQSNYRKRKDDACSLTGSHFYQNGKKRHLSFSVF